MDSVSVAVDKHERELQHLTKSLTVAYEKDAQVVDVVFPHLVDAVDEAEAALEEKLKL